AGGGVSRRCQKARPSAEAAAADGAHPASAARSAALRHAGHRYRPRSAGSLMGGRSQNPRTSSVPVEHIAHAILILRAHRVILDQDLAAIYGVTTKRLNEQVRRNRERFPDDFMFQLTAEELSTLRSQIATSNAATPGRGGRRYIPYAFTEHGAIQAANVL